MQILHLFGLSGLLSHSVFWDIFLMHPTFQFFNLSNQNKLLPKFLRANKACPGRIPQIFVHFEISRLSGGLGHLADSNSISSNPTTTYHPIQIAIIRLMPLLLFDVQLVLQFRLSLIDEVLLFDDSMIKLHNTCQIPMNCQFKKMGFCDGPRNLRKFFSVSCEVLV